MGLGLSHKENMEEDHKLEMFQSYGTDRRRRDRQAKPHTEQCYSNTINTSKPVDYRDVRLHDGRYHLYDSMLIFESTSQYSYYDSLYITVVHNLHLRLYLLLNLCFSLMITDYDDYLTMI